MWKKFAKSQHFLNQVTDNRRYICPSKNLFITFLFDVAKKEKRLKMQERRDHNALRTKECPG